MYTYLGIIFATMYPYNDVHILVVYVNGRVVSSVVTEGFDMNGDGTES